MQMNASQSSLFGAVSEIITLKMHASHSYGEYVLYDHLSKTDMTMIVDFDNGVLEMEYV